VRLGHCWRQARFVEELVGVVELAAADGVEASQYVSSLNRGFAA